MRRGRRARRVGRLRAGRRRAETETPRRLRAGAPAFDLVLLDLDMPRLDGRACVRELRSLAPALPVLLSTGLPTAELAPALIEAVSGVLPKPYTLAALGQAVAGALARHRESLEVWRADGGAAGG